MQSKTAIKRRTSTVGAVKFLSTVGDRQIKVIASDGTLDRMGDVLVPSGAQLDRYRANPVVLAQHDAASPIAMKLLLALLPRNWPMVH